MPNTYVNKVELANGDTLIDITDTTAQAADVAQGKYFYGAKTAGTASGGGTPATVVTVETLPNGADHYIITGVDISDTTAVAADVASGKYFYTAAGIKTAGTASGGGGMSLDNFLKRTEPSGAASAPTATTMRGYTFCQNSVMTSFSAPSVTRIGQRDFQSCSALETVDMPELLYAGEYSTAEGSIVQGTYCYAFAYCHNLHTVHLPKLQKPGGWMFYQCGYGQSVYNAIIVLPSLVYAGNQMFRQGKFKAVDLGPNCVKLWNDAFYYGTYDVVILRSSTLVEAATRDAVRNIRAMYVPQNLVSSYETATNWATDAALRTVNAIEGSQYENYYADGTPIGG